MIMFCLTYKIKISYTHTLKNEFLSTIVHVDFEFIRPVKPDLHKDPALKSLAAKMKQDPFRCFQFPETCSKTVKMFSI